MKSRLTHHNKISIKSWFTGLWFLKEIRLQTFKGLFVLRRLCQTLKTLTRLAKSLVLKIERVRLHLVTTGLGDHVCRMSTPASNIEGVDHLSLLMWLLYLLLHMLLLRLLLVLLPLHLLLLLYLLLLRRHELLCRIGRFWLVHHRRTVDHMSLLVHVTYVKTHIITGSFCGSSC